MTTAPDDAGAERAADTPEELVSRLVRLLDVEHLDTDLYRGPRQIGGRGRVFGGQVIAQALAAAMRSVDDGPVAHSLHAYFMRAGDEDLPIDYRVQRDFDGRSFATRRVTAIQHGQPILILAASFQRPEEGLTHQAAMPEAPPPEELISEAELLRRQGDALPAKARGFALRVRPIELRPVTPRSLLDSTKREPRYLTWFRTAVPIGDDPNLHRTILAYVSDMALLGTSLMPHGVTWGTPGLRTASLDHALWLHETPRVDEWLLYSTDSPWSGHARGFNRGQIFSRDGRLVASVAQEALIRVREPPA